MSDLPPHELHNSYYQTLKNAGVPISLAQKCAEILVKDDPRKPNLGRSEADQHLIQSGWEWMKAKKVEQ